MSENSPDYDGTIPAANNYHVVEERPHRYYTEIPNIIFDKYDLRPSAFRLYAHLKRVAADSGRCWQSQSTLAHECHLSEPIIRQAKRELQAVGLIIIRELPNKTGGRKHHEIAIVDIWQENVAHYQSKGKNLTLPKGKNLTTKNNHVEEEPRLPPSSSLRSSDGGAAPSTENHEHESPKPTSTLKNVRKDGSFPKAVLDGMVDALGAVVNHRPTNDGEWGKYRKAAKCLLQSGATPETIPKLVSSAKRLGWETKHITPMALATNFGTLNGNGQETPFDFRQDPRGDECADINVDPRL